MVLKLGSVVLEDVDQYDVLCRIMNNLKTKSTIQSNETTQTDYRVELGKDSYTQGKDCIHELHSGVLGSHQEFLVPVSAMAASSGVAFTLELWLADVESVFPFSSGANVATT